MKFYTYLYLREDGTPYYVGKGCGDRFRHRTSRHVSVPPLGRIVIQDFEFEFDALVAEMFLIDYYGRKDLGKGILRNLTNGGEGVSGFRHSAELRERFSQERKGRLFYRPPRLTHCKQGHEMSLENIYVRPDGGRSCKLCQKARSQAHLERNKLSCQPS